MKWVKRGHGQQETADGMYEIRMVPRCFLWAAIYNGHPLVTDGNSDGRCYRMARAKQHCELHAARVAAGGGTLNEELLDADAEFALADAAALGALRAALWIGRVVTWEHGRHTRVARVVEVLGFAYEHASVRVRGMRSTYDVPASTLVAALKERARG